MSKHVSELGRADAVQVGIERGGCFEEAMNEIAGTSPYYIISCSRKLVGLRV